jgi:hypothetical protein
MLNTDELIDMVNVWDMRRVERQMRCAWAFRQIEDELNRLAQLCVIAESLVARPIQHKENVPIQVQTT